MLYSCVVDFIKCLEWYIVKVWCIRLEPRSNFFLSFWQESLEKYNSSYARVVICYWTLVLWEWSFDFVMCYWTLVLWELVLIYLVAEVIYVFLKSLILVCLLSFRSLTDWLSVVFNILNHFISEWGFTVNFRILVLLSPFKRKLQQIWII